MRQPSWMGRDLQAEHDAQEPLTGLTCAVSACRLCSAASRSSLMASSSSSLQENGLA